jgi:signal transduction histidine kinase
MQVQNHNRQLEEMVRERTSELVAAQDQLMRKNEELSLALEKASEVAELKSQFLTNINHEIRTPINGILGTVDLISESPLNAEQRECAEMLKTSAGALVKLMNAILDVSELGAGKLRVQHRSFDLLLLLEEVSAVYRSRAHAKGLKFTISAPLTIPRSLRGDPVRLRQVLDQLLCNAVKFTPNGKVSLNVEIVHETADTLAIKLAVEDTGIGITAEQRTRLFQVFMQGDGSSTRRYGGTGIGLTLSKQLVELLGGDIGVDNLAAGGTKAWFTAVLEKETSMVGAQAVEGSSSREFA